MLASLLETIRGFSAVKGLDTFAEAININPANDTPVSLTMFCKTIQDENEERTFCGDKGLDHKSS